MFLVIQSPKTCGKFHPWAKMIAINSDGSSISLLEGGISLVGGGGC